MGRKKILVMGADDLPGGVSSYVNELIRLCSKEKYEFHMTVSGAKLSGIIINSSIIRHILPVKYSILTILPQTLRLRHLITTKGIELLHLHTARAGFIGCIAAIGLSVPIIYTGHSWRYEQKYKWIFKKLFYCFEKFICHRANIVTFCTEFDKEFGIKNKLAKESKGVVIATRMNTSDYENIKRDEVSTIRKGLNIPDDALVIGTIGYMSERKDPLTFVRIAGMVLRDVPDAFFLWVGDGDLKEKATQLSKELGIGNRFIVTGFITSDRIPLYLKLMKIFLFTSHFEGVPLSIMAAQASSLPIVCSNYKGSGIDELIVHGKTGYIFNPSDAETASRYVMTIIENPDETKQLIEQMVISFVNTHGNPIIMAKEYEKIYDAL
ncbi:MAG: glycosyltransferase [Legionellales bacterium]